MLGGASLSLSAFLGFLVSAGTLLTHRRLCLLLGERRLDTEGEPHALISILLSVRTARKMGGLHLDQLESRACQQTAHLLPRGRLPVVTVQE